MFFIIYTIPPTMVMAIPRYNNGVTIVGSVVKYSPPTGHNGSIQNGSDFSCGMRTGIVTSKADTIMLPMKNTQLDTNCLEIDNLFLIDMMEPANKLTVPV